MQETPTPAAGPATPDAAAPRLAPPPSSARARRVRWLVTGLVVLAVVLTAGGAVFFDTTPERVDRQQTLVLGQTQFAPGSRSAVRIVVRDAPGGDPVPNADVQVSLVPAGGGQAAPLFSGKTGADGAVAATFTVPQCDDPKQTLVVSARSATGYDEVQQEITLQRSYKLLLTSDKPVYQPGQTVHMRALAFSTIDMKAAAASPIEFLVEDPKGNKIFRQTVPASPFGVAAADFALAGEVTNGDYKLSVGLGDTTSEKTIAVKPYVLPKFAVKATTERSFYLPGDRVVGAVQCDYFFGKPTADARVEIVGSVFDVEQTEVVRVEGRTDADGAYRFEFELPKYLAGGGLERDRAEFSLQIAVVDEAEHAEQTSLVLPVARDPLAIAVVAEAGVLKPGVENRLYILTSYPDGRPARCTLKGNINGRTLALETGEYGLTEYAFTPPPGASRLALTAADEQGSSASKTVDLSADQAGEVVLLRLDRATYRLGDTMRLTALTSQGFGSVFLDIVRDRQTLSTRSAPAENGRAEFAVDLSGDLFGTLALHAYKVLADGSIIRDTRVVVVDAPRDVATTIQADRDVYRPGETATLSFQTSTAAGPAQAALGVSIVDESVFAVMEQDPGFAKLYFLLQKELLEPRYKIAGFTVPEVLTKTESADLQTSRDRAARAAWAPLQPAALAMSVNSRPAKLEAAEQARQSGLSRVSNLALGLLILVPLGLWAAAVLGLRASGVLGRAAGRFGLVVLVLLFGSPFACMGLSFCLVVLAEGLPGDVGSRVIALILGALLAGWLAAVAAFAVYAWLRHDERARIIWLLTAAWVALGVVLAVALALGANPDGWLAALAILAYLAGLLALLLFGVGLYVEGHRGAAAAAVALVLLFVPAMFAAAALPALAEDISLVRILGDPVVYAGPVGWLAGCSAAPQVGDAMRNLPGALGLAGASAPEAKPAGTPEAPTGAVGAVREPPAAQAPRLRQFFPETLLWVPELTTDAGGYAALDVPLADSITTWRVTALASTQDGQLGFANAGLRVFQDFFVDIDLPVALTQNDEVAIPVAVYNYLPEAQQVGLEVTAEPWFELLDEPAKALEIAANDVDVVYFRIRVLQFGERSFQVTALGERMSDAIKRTVSVVPDGRRFRDSQSDWLRQGATVTASLPTQAISGTARLEVKIYPGVVSQLVEGLEKILRLPYG